MWRFEKYIFYLSNLSFKIYVNVNKLKKKNFPNYNFCVLHYVYFIVHNEIGNLQKCIISKISVKRTMLVQI